MKIQSVLGIVFFTCVAAMPTQAGESVSSAQCQSWFKTLDRNGDGTLGATENASKMLGRVTLATEERSEYVMTKTFFMIECKIGSFGKPPA